MKTTILRHAGMGFLLGCFANLLFSVVVSLRMNTGDFYFALPALTNDYASELTAALVQITTFVWLGAACGIAYLFAENVDLEPAKQGIGYFASLTTGVLPLVWVGRWYEHFFIGLFSYIIVVAAISLLIFVIVLAKLKRDVDEIKRTIGIRKGTQNEEV